MRMSKWKKWVKRQRRDKLQREKSINFLTPIAPGRKIQVSPESVRNDRFAFTIMIRITESSAAAAAAVD